MTQQRLALAWAISVACLGCLGCKDKPKAPEQPATPGEAWLSAQQVEKIQIATTPVEEREVGGDLAAAGRIAFDDLRVSHVFSPVSGRVTSIRAQPGQRVAKGAPLAGLQSPDLGSALADVNKAQADLTAAEHELKRQQELLAAQAGTQRDLELAQDNEAKSRAELQRARAKGRLLRSGGVDTVTQEFLLRAPIAGEVIARNVNPGSEIVGQYSGGQSQELFTVGALDEVWLIADIFEIDLAQVKLGAPVIATVVAYPENRYQGRLDWIADSLDPTTRTAKVRCTIKNPARELKPEMYATASIAVPKRKALAIPREALLRLGDETVVFVQAGKNESGMTGFQRRVVKVDETVSGPFLPVTSGLIQGDMVVVSGGLLLSGMI